MEIDIHADDYALTLSTSKDILDCIKAGRLCSISIVPNMSCLDACMELLYQEIPTLSFLPLMSVHLNFVEGNCLSAALQKDSLLLGADRKKMGLSWGKLFFMSYLPWKRKETKRQLKKEVKAQIEIVCDKIERCITIAKENGVACAQKGIRLDSHQHAHMIPVVWEAVLETVEEEGYSLEYIRNSKEVFLPFVTAVSLWKTYRPINFVKNRLLSLYSHKVDVYQRKCHMEQMYLWGLVMSGSMDIDRIRLLYPRIAAKAKKQGRVLEILFHPGKALPQEVSQELDAEAVRSFYLSENRHIEKKAVLQFEEKEVISKRL